jgi:hypothetical protein
VTSSSGTSFRGLCSSGFSYAFTAARRR